MAKQSEQLTAFYRAYKSWVEAGAPVENEHGFSRGIGLCANLSHFYISNPTLERQLRREMQNQFIDADFDWQYPFNVDGWYYREECFARQTYLNKKRLEWVYNHCENV